jgi:hypothetical protein
LITVFLLLFFLVGDFGSTDLPDLLDLHDLPDFIDLAETLEGDLIFSFDLLTDYFHGLSFGFSCSISWGFGSGSGTTDFFSIGLDCSFGADFTFS